MGKNKLAKFAEMETFANVYQFPANQLELGKANSLKGNWNEQVFHNQNPVVLELGCGKGEYTVGLAQLYPDKNFIGIDIKGARMWSGAKQALEQNITNAAFLRTNIEMADLFFGAGEVSEIWLTFPDPQMKKVNKRLTSTPFISRYLRFLKPGGTVHLKTDSRFMFTYTCEMAKANHFPVSFCTDDLYHSGCTDKILSLKTFYEQLWLSRGLNIKYIRFEPQPRDTLVEPDVEIERDNYTSKVEKIR